EIAIMISVDQSRAMTAREQELRSSEVHPSNKFFFSSRRRHTSSKRDWSSDVCSSDLSVNGPYPLAEPAIHPSIAPAFVDSSTLRSEERRVGKECISRMARYICKKNTSCVEGRTRLTKVMIQQCTVCTLVRPEMYVEYR